MDTPHARHEDLQWLVARPIAHRGLHNRAHGVEENTSTAFAAAIGHDYAIECDLQLSADGEAMVFHDAGLDRLTHASGQVCERSASELAALPLRIGHDRMQPLAALFDQVAGQVPLVIELKSLWNDDPALAERAGYLASRYNGPVALMSFDPGLARAARLSAPGVPAGLVADRFTAQDWPELTREQRQRLAAYDSIAGFNPDFMSFGLDMLAGSNAEKFRATGRPVICWTVRSAQVARQALEHCDQITFEGFLP